MDNKKHRRVIPMAPPKPPTAPEAPRARKLPISRLEADLYLRLEADVIHAQDKLQSGVTALLAAHGVSQAQGVRLEGFPERPTLVFLDLTGVVRPLPQAPPDAPPPPPPPGP